MLLVLKEVEIFDFEFTQSVEDMLKYFAEQVISEIYLYTGILTFTMGAVVAVIVL
jgi:hypothetical protein